MYGQPGHTSRSCQQNKGAEQRTLPTKPNSDEDGAPAEDPGVQRGLSPSMVGSRKVEWAEGEETLSLRSKAFRDCLTIEVKIGGVKTNCLLNTGSEVTTITESFYRRHFEGQESSLTSAKWVPLTAPNGLNIPIVDWLEAVECMGKTLHRKCVFVLTDTGPGVEGMDLIPGLIGINIINELQDLLIQAKGVKRMDRYGLQERPT